MNKKEKTNKIKNRFNIDFFEFCALVEACIPDSPIMRAMFWDKVIDLYYHELTVNERSRLYSWINRNPSFQYSLEKNNEGCIIFNARYNPDNQYKVTTNYIGEIKVNDCFKLNDRYYLSKTVSINEDYITNIEHIKMENNE